MHRWSLSYIIVQPEFSVLVGMRNRLCHELHFCHCDPGVWHKPPCQWGSHANSRVSVEKKKKKLNSSRQKNKTSKSNKNNNKKSPWAVLLPAFAEVKPSCSTWVTPFIPIACLVKGGWGKKGCVMYVHLGKKRQSNFFFFWNKMAEAARGQAHRPRRLQHIYPPSGCFAFRMIQLLYFSLQIKKQQQYISIFNWNVAPLRRSQGLKVRWPLDRVGQWTTTAAAQAAAAAAEHKRRLPAHIKSVAKATALFTVFVPIPSLKWSLYITEYNLGQ